MSQGRMPDHVIRDVIAEALDNRHFATAAPSTLLLEKNPAETLAWELFRGQLVPGHLTRQQRTFESWNLFGNDESPGSAEPLLAVKIDLQNGELHVVRGLLCYVWEGYDAGDNAILSREVQRWTRELAGTLHLDDFSTAAELQAALAGLLTQAVIGASRLPLTSVEAPLPAWSLGRLAYFHGGMKQALADPQRAAKALEWLLRSTSRENQHAIAEQLGRRDVQLTHLLQKMFNEASLSPHTDFVEKTLAFLHVLVAQSLLDVKQHIDFLSWLLLQLGRHLTAYDLITFHHRGANYPDALLLDAALKDFLRLIEQYPDLFQDDDALSRTRRRALRAGWLHRRRYEGHPVPDAPTSPGENRRVLPSPYLRVPEDQILNIGKRRRRLYAGDPLPSHAGPQCRNVLQRCGDDLKDPSELRELGTALFVERPLATPAAPGALDRSPLLAHEAFSRSLAERALGELAQEPLLHISAETKALRLAELAQLPLPSGIPATSLTADANRVVSLADAVKAARDFVILRTLPGSVRAFCREPLIAHALAERGIHMDESSDWLIVGMTDNGAPQVCIQGKRQEERWRLEFDSIGK